MLQWPVARGVDIPVGEIVPSISTIVGPIGSETVALHSVTAAVPLEIWSPAPFSLQPFAPQLGTTNNIFTLTEDLSHGVYRNGSIWFSHTIYLPFFGPTRSAVQWWELLPDATTVQRGRVDDPGNEVFYANASLAVNAAGDVLLGYSSFSTSQYATANYSFRAALDPPDSLRPPFELKAGEDPYVRLDPIGLNRWGDHSTTVVDPLDDTALWTLQEYATTSNRWGTWWGQVEPPDFADLSISKQVSPPITPAGSNITYTLTITNHGPAAAAEVTVVDVMPTGAGLVSAVSSTGICSVADTTVTCVLGTLASGSVETVTITMTQTIAGVQVNTAVVSTILTDTNLADNVAAAEHCVTFATPPPVWINEIHYDDTTFLDIGEGVEIAGPAGTDLAGLSIVLYDGPSGGEYRTVDLSGVIDNETNAYGALWFSIFGIQGGIASPDGIALVPACTGVIQFLSYEGTFIASDGPANGLLSTDIGVSESNATTAVGDSLQLLGTGIQYSAFTWSGPVSNSPGQLNSGQIIPVDPDNDGIPSDWELLYFGGPTNADPNADGDHDGASNGEEYGGDTDPTNRHSFFWIEVNHLVSSNSIFFQTSTARVYGVDWKSNLLIGSWLNVQSNIPGTGNEIAVPDTNAPPDPVYYRGNVDLP